MKFKSLKENKIIISSIAMTVLALCSLTFISYAKSKSTEGSNQKSIIIDAGHGGEDGGAVGSEGTIEKDINLAIALKLESLLEASGHKVIMTREKDTAIYDDSAKTLKEKKKSDLRNRMGIMNKNKEQVSLSI